jgi:alpha-L-arabinofuranosidase
MNGKNYRKWATALGCALLTLPSQAGVPDSVYVYPYHTGNNGQGGLNIAWSADQTNWKAIGPKHTFVSSDFGVWGGQKRMFHPYTVRLSDGTWRSVWQVNTNINQFAVAESKDLVHWIPQDYPYMQGVSSCIDPVLQVDEKRGEYTVYFLSDGKYYRTVSTDFYHFSNPVQVDASAYKDATVNLTINGEVGNGQIIKVPYSVAEYLEMAVATAQAKNALYDEKAKDDATRFAGLKSLEAQVTVSANHKKEISDKLIGIFFEDISYAADGGLYAELVQNRDFEYSKNDNGGWNALTSWSIKGDGMTMRVETDAPIHENNAHYVVLDITTPSASLVNEGFDGIAVKKGEKYDFSLFAKALKGKGGKCTVQLQSDGKVIGSTSLTIGSASAWKKLSTTLTASEDAANAQLVITPQESGSLALDMISLFPQKTFKGRKNGLRADLAQLLADLKPKFIRFPGGCATHGNGIENIYHWNESVGSLESRKPAFNIWHYHQTRGLGFYEYFQFCEDIGAEPLPVLAAGVPCQNSSHGGHGQQGGIPMEEMPAYIEEILNLIEWANGDAKTSKWAKMRAEAGHPKPFNLKYIGIGNEDLISKTFEERYLMIVKAVKEKYPEITVCGTVGPWCEGSDYEQGWKIATENHIDMVDEHYYQTPGWFIYNQDYYDQYDRKGPKVYVGEYAAHLPGRPNNIETALAEALHICNMERNGDVVSMSSYAPLFAKEKHTNWNPDMIYFNNTSARPMVGYYTQQMHSLHSGNEYLDSKLTVNESKKGVRERMTVSTVRDSKKGVTYLKLVNMMPYEVSTKVSADGLISGTTTAKSLVLTGKPESTDSTPQESSVEIAPEFTYVMPAYSFTIITIPDSQKAGKKKK